MSKMTKQQTLTITIIWIAVVIVAILAFLFFGKPVATNRDKIVINVVTDSLQRVEPNYTHEAVPENITAAEIVEMTGNNPFPTYVPQGYVLSGTTLYVPSNESGTELRDDTVFGVLYTNPESESYSLLIKASKSDKLKITEDKAAFNLTLTDPTQEWSFAGGYKVKIFKQDNIEQYAVLFMNNGHLWRVDSLNLPQEELLEVVKALLAGRK